MNKKKNVAAPVPIKYVSKHLHLPEESVEDVVNDSPELFEVNSRYNGSSDPNMIAISFKPESYSLSTKGKAFARELRMKGYAYFQTSVIHPIIMRFLFAVAGFVCGYVMNNWIH